MDDCKSTPFAINHAVVTIRFGHFWRTRELPRDGDGMGISLLVARWPSEVRLSLATWQWARAREFGSRVQSIPLAVTVRKPHILRVST